MEDPTLPDISFLQNAPFSCRFLVPQNQTYQFLILAPTQKWRKHLPDKISKLLFQVWKNILKIPIYLSTCLSIGWCTTFITFVSWSCPFSSFPTHLDQRPASHSPPPLLLTPPNHRQRLPQALGGPDLIKALSGTSDPFFCVDIGWIFKM